MKIFYNQNKKETFTYLLLWFLIFLSPPLSNWIHSHIDGNLAFRWSDVITSWKQLFNFFVVFLIHNHILAPIFVYKRKRMLYIGLTALLVVLFMVMIYAYRPVALQPPVDVPPLLEAVPHGGPHGGPHGNFQPPLFDRHDIISFLILVLVFGFNIGIKQYFRAEAESERLKELERENITQQLDYLKYQVNPHFFMNTLNNIHALVDIDPERAKKTIVMLSKLMRYVLYDGAKSLIPLQHEIDFLNNYVELMRLRFNDNVEITSSLPTHAANVSFPPLLFIMYIENAFKHGVSYSSPSFVKIELTVDDERIAFSCTNSRVKDHHSEPGGVGLENAHKRLDLLYGDAYTLRTGEDGDTYRVSLNIPVSVPLSKTLTPKNI